MASELPTKAPVSHQVSTLDRHDDPFAPREGKTLIWKDINMTLVCDVLCKNATSSSFFFLRFLTRLNLTVSSFLYVHDTRPPKATNRNASC
jgi:hypothetical protein